MTSWGSYEDRNGSRLRVGIDITRSPSSLSHSTTNIDLTVRFYVDSDGGDFAGDTQTMSFGGAFGGSTTFTNNSGTILVATKHLNNVPINYAGTGTRTFSAKISGAYNGVTPSHKVTYGLPARPAAPPDKVATPTVDNIGTGSARARWSAPDSNGSAITKYRVLFEFPSGANASDTVNGDREHTTYVLNPGQEYSVRVAAANSKGYGDFSNKRWFTTDVALPGKVGTPTVSNITATTCIVNYSAPSDGGGTIDFYEVNIDTPGEGFLRFTDGNGPPSYTGVNGLPPGTDLDAQVRAHNQAGYGAWSNKRYFTTLVGTPGAPKSISLTTVDHQSVKVTWQPPTNTGGGTITGYAMGLCPIKDQESKILTGITDGSGREYTFEGLEADTLYWVFGRAQTSAGYGTASSWDSTTTDPPPITDPSLAPQVVSKTACSVTLKGVAGTMTREFQLALDETFETGLMDHTVTTVSSQFLDLTPGATYYGRYRVDSGSGFGDYSPAVEFTLARRPVRWDGDHWVDDVLYWDGDDWGPATGDLKVWDGDSWS